LNPTLVFDIETVPDVAGLRRVSALSPELTDADVLDWALQQRRAASGNEFVPPYLQRVVAIACALREGEILRVASVGAAGDGEAELIRRFFDLIDRHTPQLVSWNGGGFDLPVLCHRAIIHGLTAAKFWDWGDDDREFKFNSYLGRYHTRHLDLMDVLALYQPRNYAGLDAMARLSGFPGKLGLAGSEVQGAFAAGRIEEILPLLRDRRAQHLPLVSALPAAARNAFARRARERGRARAREARRIEGAALARVSRRLGQEQRQARMIGSIANLPPSTVDDDTPHQRSSTVA
jgi:predicted PolB exonuclease-like 3'-5' exonuclease